MQTWLMAENTILNWLAGDDPARGGSPRMQWLNLPESWGAFLLIAMVGLIIFAVFWLYRRESNTCPEGIKVVLACLRLAVLLMLVAMLLRPSMFYQQVNEIKPTIDLVRDSSLSFARGDRYRDQDHVQQLAESTGMEESAISDGSVSRAKLLNLATKDPRWLEQIRAKGAVQVIDFSDGTTSVAVIPAIIESNLKSDSQDEADNVDDQPESTGQQLIQKSVPELSPTGLGTDIWQALRESLEDAANLSAIVLVSDGQHNGSEDPVEMALRAASLDIPIHVIGVGDPNPPRNIAVTEVFVRDKAYPDEPFEVEALLQATSSDNDSGSEQVQVDLVEQQINDRTGRPGNEKVVKSKSVTLPTGGGRVRLDFDHTVNRPGRYVYTVRTEVVDDETDPADNAMQSGELEVIDDQVRVLLISGLPSWDYQQVQKLLQRDQTISLSCWLQSMDQTRPQEGNEPISRLPRTIEELGQYNVIIMMDPNPEEFDSEWIENLKTFCKNKAGGLLYMAGPHFTGEFVTLNRLQGIRNILPVRLGDSQYIASSDALAFAAANSLAPMLLVKHNLDHPVLSFHADPMENEKRWASMPGIYWSFPALAGKPTARVLMERGDQVGAEGNIPLIATGRYGAGTVLYLGFPGTWRWRPAGLQAQFFDRFWIQVVRYLIENRSLQGSRRGFIDTDKTEYELGERIVFVSKILDEQFMPSVQESITVNITNDDGRVQKTELQLLPGNTGQYQGNVIASRTGTYRGSVELAGNESDELVEPITYRIVAPKVESSSFWLNERLLKEIAEKSGGQYFRVNEISKLPDVLPTRVQRVSFKSPAKPIWDWNQIFRMCAFFLPVVLLTAEWAMRKWYKLL